MGEYIEIIPIDIPEDSFNRYIVSLMEQLLLIDEKLFNSKPQEAR